ncbi:sodium channel protein 1 brain-like isoform X2 [Asterias rubens]|uniref:sodium channel protein 1 brain-like isoform X2 n=1 Tax=Asterias rubens TaxID=7604 RepID=UPI001454F5E9|nr:sodium channel protein 1 brain-like isoform X2 [Asterias rubens]
MIHTKNSKMTDKSPNPNFKALTKEALVNLKLKGSANNAQPTAERAFSRLSLMSEMEEEEVETGKVYDTDLADGKDLPESLGTFPKSLYGKPIEELDAVRHDEQTFCVVGKRFGKSSLFRLSSTESCFLLSPLNPIRKFMLYVLTNQFFDVFVILTILVNCVFLALDAPKFDPNAEDSVLLAVAEYVFTGIYTVEMVVKIIARGFILQKKTYLRDPWNWLDFSVIVLAYVTFILEFGGVPVGNLSGIRTFRVLRAFKTISVIPGLKSIINALLRSAKMLGEVFLLTVFVLAIFALVSLQLYMGVLRQKCVLNINITAINETEEFYYNFIQNETHWKYWNDEPLVCNNITGVSTCMGDTNYTCLPDIGKNPNGQYGYTSFDNIGWAMLTCFQIFTLDFWENTYNLVIAAMGGWSVVFFFLAVMLGSFYLINLMLAVVFLAYTEEMENQGKEKEKKAQQIRENIFNMDAEKLKRLAEKKRRRKERRDQMRKLQLQNLEKIEGGGGGAEANDNEGFNANEKMDNDSDNTSKMSQKNDDDKSADVSKDDSKSQNGSEDGSNVIMNNPDDTDDGSDLPVPCCPYKSCCVCCLTCCVCPRGIYRNLRKGQYYCALFVLDPLMDLFITLCILLNTVFLMLDHHNINAEMDNVLDIGNKVFTVIFTIECGLKLIALEVKFFKGGWNVFDLVIVIFSLMDLFLSSIPGLSVLRTFRLLRILKLAQSWTTMRMLIMIIGNTIGALGNVSLVLLIIIYVFAVMGMQLFGANYTEANFNGEIPRWHFRDIYHSLLLIFRILCGEWIEPMYECMDCSDAAVCIIIFISSFIVGNIMILNLFLALLINAFASDSLKKKDEEENRIGLAIAKLKRFAIFIFCCCCKEFRRPSKIGVEGSKDDAMIEAKGENGTDNTRKASVTKFMVVDEDDRISQISLDNGGQHYKSNGLELTPVRHRNSLVSIIHQPNGSLHDGSIYNGSIHRVSVGNGGMLNGLMQPSSRAHSPVPIGNALMPNGLYSNGPSRNGSARSIKRPMSHTIYSSIANLQVDNMRDNPSMPAVRNTDSETGEQESSKIVPDQAVEVRIKSAATQRGDEALVEAGIIEDPVHDCFPKKCDLWCIRKCTCTFCTDPDNSRAFFCWRKFRETMCTIIENRVFEGFILLAICASSITLTFEDINLPGNLVLQEILAISNIVFCVIFVFEMLMKWIGMGFVKYFTSFWCWLDFIVVIVAVVSLIGDSLGLSGVSAFKVLRTLRALRPLRAISRWQGMKIVVNAVAHAIPAIFNVVVVCVVFWLIFSIMGVQFFKGSFSKCVDENDELLPITIVNNFTDCINLNYTWKVAKVNFDNIFSGYLALFQVATFEGWLEVIQASVDSRGPDMQPSYEASPIAYIFFVVFIIFGAFFTLNLFIGVIIDNFNELKRKYEGDSSFGMFLTSNQKNYYQTMRRLGVQKPTKQIKQPTNKIQEFFFKLTSSTKFEIVIVSIIFANMIAMTVEHYKQSQEFTNVLKVFNIVFTVIFTFEMILKWIGYRLHYFRIPWNVFDFIVVTFSLLGILLDDVLSSSFINPTILRVFRLIRIGRILRLIKSAKGIRKLLFALAVSMPALVNIGALLFMIIFIFSIIGMAQFAYVKKQGAIDDTVNFETWLNSMMLLFRFATSAGWNDVLDPLMTAPPECDPTYMDLPNGNCGNYIFAALFCFLFLVMTFLVIVNVYVAVILENFSQAHAQEEVGITEDDFGMFYQVWQKFDPNATQFIMYEQLSTFCDTLEHPLRLEKPNNIKIAGLELPIYDDIKLHCLDVLFALTKRVLGDVEESEEFKELQAQMSIKFKESFPDRGATEPTTTTLQIKKRGTAAKKIQRAFRRYRLMVEMRKASTAYRNQQSLEGSRRNSINPDLDSSMTSQTFGQTLTIPSGYGVDRSATPTIPEQSYKSDNEAYRVDNDGDDVPTIDASEEIRGNDRDVMV